MLIKAIKWLEKKYITNEKCEGWINTVVDD